MSKFLSRFPKKQRNTFNRGDLTKAGSKRNRDGSGRTHDKKCRLMCGEEESMLHLTKCKNGDKFWKFIFDTCKSVFGMPDPYDKSAAIIFNIWNSNQSKPTLGPMAACALVRHAFNCYYYELVTVATNPQKLFRAEHVFARTMRSYTNAVRSHAQAIKIQITKNKYTPKPSGVAPATLKPFAQLFTMNPNTGEFTLNDKLTQAEDRANTLSKNLHDNQHTARHA